MTRHLHKDRRATTALETALVFPVFILFIFGLFAIYSLITARRAMDYGLEKALRFATVNGTTANASTQVQTTFANAATLISNAVGATAVVSIGVNGSTPSTTFPTFKPSDTITVAISYAWAAPTATIYSGTSLFPGLTLTASASMRITN